MRMITITVFWSLLMLPTRIVVVADVVVITLVASAVISAVIFLVENFVVYLLLPYTSRRSDYHDSFAQYITDNQALFPPNFTGCVTNFCYPEMFFAKNADSWRERFQESPVTIWQVSRV